MGALLPTVNGIISSMDGDITFMGRVMAQLPLEPPMSKLIYFGYIFNILSEAIIMGNFVLTFYKMFSAFTLSSK